MPLSKVEGLAHANQIERGNLASLGVLLRSMLTGDYASKLPVPPPAGISAGVGTIYRSRVDKIGGLINTTILIDLTGLSSSTTDLDVIGQGAAAAAHIGQLSLRRNGLILAGRMTCLELPVGGVVDIDLYHAVEATAKFDDGIAALTETALITAGGNWTLALTKAIADPVGIADHYLYLTCGAAGVPAAYTAGKFLLELFGYDAGDPQT